MGETTIQWTDYTFNPWVGCQRVSPGCTNCYAEAYDKRVGGVPKSQRADPSKPLLRWGPHAPRVRTSAANWRKPFKWNAEAQAAGVRKRVFCASLADVFEDRAELIGWRADLFAMVVELKHLDWLLLTKRPENLAAMWPYGRHPAGKPLSNVWLGTTVEDQQRANERIPALLSAPAVVHFLSAEPLLGPVDLRAAGAFTPGRWGSVRWVIVGGESGGGARPFDVQWARSLVGQCRDGGRAEAAPFVKQLGAHVIGRDSLRHRLRDSHGGDMAEWPADLRVREFPEARR